ARNDHHPGRFRGANRGGARPLLDDAELADQVARADVAHDVFGAPRILPEHLGASRQENVELVPPTTLLNQDLATPERPVGRRILDSGELAARKPGEERQVFLGGAAEHLRRYTNLGLAAS